MKTPRNLSLEQISPLRTKLQRRILGCFNHDRYTADEVAGLLGIHILTGRPRVAELVKKGFLCDSGLRRDNASGKKAVVWEIKKDGQQFLPLTVHNNETGKESDMTSANPNRRRKVKT